MQKEVVDAVRCAEDVIYDAEDTFLQYEADIVALLRKTHKATPKVTRIKRDHRDFYGKQSTRATKE